MTEELRFRTATVADVSFPKRQVDLVVMPYEAETLIVERGKTFTEIVRRGASTGSKPATTVSASTHLHDLRRTVGRATVPPSRQDGLVAEPYLTNRAGRRNPHPRRRWCVDASAGFGLLRDSRPGRPERRGVGNPLKGASQPAVFGHTRRRRSGV
jgi:hypothetical protein